jgi:HTH-type transcriptional regulator / antitoxin HipB
MSKSDPKRESIGAFVRERRESNQLTQRELAELAGVGVRFVSELERNKPTLCMGKVDAVLAVFGKTLGIVDSIRDEL